MSPTEPETEHEGERLRSGTQVAEYTIESLLGAGGFARVYRARHITLGTEVAIKVLSRALALDPQATARFIREAQAASRITHPNVVRVLGFGRHEDGRAYQVMDLVDGPPLDERLADVGRLAIGEALALLEGIVAGLEAAHEIGIVHRDLKPSNVLLARAGDRCVPRLCDFGIAKAIAGDEDPRLTQTGVTLGTPMYMSPEQALGREITSASDVYAFGVVAFELLTGRVPFTAETPFETMMMHVQDRPPTASSVAPGLATSFDAVFERMLAKDPADRPTLAHALRDLRAAASSPRRGLPLRRLAIGVVVLGCVAVGGTWQWRDRSPSPSPSPASPPIAHPVEHVAPAAPVQLEERPVEPPKSAPARVAPRAAAHHDAKPADSFEAPPGYE